jgi:hypothetical protein
MSGKALVTGLGILLILFTAGLWYTQFHAYYYDLPPEPLVIEGTEYPVETWIGTDASSSPLKRRVCVTFTEEVAQTILAAHSHLDEAEPLVAPDWFECFDAGQIDRDVASGTANAFKMGPSGFDGVDDYLALYPDGMGFIWRQILPDYEVN